MSALWKIQGNLSFKIAVLECTRGEDPGQSHREFCNDALSVLLSDPLASMFQFCQSDK